jgi:phosphate transport system ATP-binding protein
MTNLAEKKTKIQKNNSEYAAELQSLNIYYGDFHAVKDINIKFEKKRITSIIGPSGCGKSTVLRSLNRMNELIPGTKTEGKILFHGINIYGEEINAVEIRRKIGMVFQKPNPFPKSIYNNIAWGAKINGFKGDMDRLVEESLKAAALWDEVKDKLNQNALRLSGGQQQRLCIARAIAVKPEIILMDEPASALDPVSTLRIEELMTKLAEDYTIIIVTHNMQQASRISDFTAFLMVDENKSGYLVEYAKTEDIFLKPENKKTEDYISGRFG